MKKTYFVICVLGIFAGSIFAAAPKREMRATWLTTVANIDWPLSSTKTISAQQKELTTMLDSIQTMRMNTVFFHIRPASDALYKSAYEPWSSYLNHGRGVDPGYDPLQFCIDECHKRGLSCHGWINPYRYNERGGYDWKGNNDTTKLNYKYTHPDWLLWYNNDIVLDPANPEVIQRIKEVVGDMINKYDLDGILMDDYFYPYGGTSTQDAESVAKWKPADMNVGDWRRQNVNRMVAAVYDTIRAVKPWVTFGVSPFGIWTTNTTVAKQRGITLPSNISGGNMYAEIYCDPVAWLEEGTVDYVSPQLYWKIGGGQDYKTLAQWWADITSRFGKHFYSSMAIYRYQQGNDGFTVADMQSQAQLNRVVTDNAPGAVFYQTRGWVYDKSFRRAFQKAEFQYPSLAPAINWKPAKERVMVDNMVLTGQELTWTHPDKDVYFAVYAVQNSFKSRANIWSYGETLLGVTYTNSFTLPAKITAGAYKIAVSVLDKYNNEYALRIYGDNTVEPEAATLQVPAEGNTHKVPFTFEWSKVSKADSYIIQMARDEQMQDIVFTQEVLTNSFATSKRKLIEKLPYGTYYWRVKSRIPNSGDCWSKVQCFKIGVRDAEEQVQAEENVSHKELHNGQLTIVTGSKTYTATGAVIK